MGGVVLAGAEAGEEEVFVGGPFLLRFGVGEEGEWVWEGRIPGFLRFEEGFGVGGLRERRLWVGVGRGL